MRIEDPDGAWRVSDKDPRIMRRREPDDFGGTYYHLISEGIINNWDGFEVKLAPARWGLDLNRNYPNEWAPEGEQKGAGDYPFSEPETRAEAEFWATHRNIIEARLNLPGGVSPVTGKVEQETGQLEGRTTKIYGGWFSSSDLTENARKLERVVSAPGGGEVEIMIKSERAGTVRTRLELD
jgi:hypothetical protein